MGLGKLLNSFKNPTSNNTVAAIVFAENMKRKKVNKLVALSEIKDLKEAIESEEWLDIYHLFIEFYHTMVNYRERAEGVFHPSSLKTDCERRLWYDLKKVRKTDTVYSTHTGRSQAIFDLGTFVHLYIQSLLRRAGALVAAEVSVKSKEWFIEGHTDGIIEAGWFGLEERAILEIKTINLNGAKALQYGPLEPHKEQAGLYAHRKGYKWVYFVYYIKDTSEIKEFKWQIEEDRLDLQYDFMEKILDSPDGKNLEKVCPRISCDAAKKCAWRTLCFSDSTS